MEMQKDLKIGLISGLILAALAAVWLSTRPSLSIRARMPHSRNAKPPETTTMDEQPRFTIDLPNTTSSDTTAVIKSEQTNIPDLTVHEQPEEVKAQKFHIVRKGETLSNISYKYYGSAGKWQKIYNANRKAIKDPRKLRPGTKLIIPE
jgi:nucleoid-associated protein YgaU